MWSLAINSLKADWRAGEWRIIVLALLLTVSSLSAVGLFVERVMSAMQQQAGSLLGGDARISSTRPLADDYRIRAQAHGLNTADSLSLLSMVMHNEDSALIEVNGLSDSYPLRGKIETLEPQNRSTPAPGTAWIDSRLKTQLQLKIGDVITIGTRDLIVAAEVTRDVDMSISVFRIAPRLMMNLADLASTELIQPTSRLKYRLMLAGEQEKLSEFITQLQPDLQAAEQLETIKDARPEIRETLERSAHFLGLAALATAILAGVSLWLAAQRFVTRQLDTCAIMRCLGASQQQIINIFFIQFLIVGVIAAALGCLIGYGAQELLSNYLEAWRNIELPTPSLLPLLQACLAGLVLLFGFAGLPLLQLRNTPALRVLRRELGLPSPKLYLMYGIAAFTLSALFVWQANSVQLGLATLAGVVLALLTFMLITKLMLHSICHYFANSRHWTLSFVANQLLRRNKNAMLQVAALSLGGMALLLLTLVRNDLLQQWQQQIPPNTPNHFLVNAQTDQLKDIEAFFQQNQIKPPMFMPMIKGRLVAINQQEINLDNFQEQRQKRLLEREFNLSYDDYLPNWNTISSGHWWKNSENGALSVEEGLAQRLQLKLGDTLSFDIAGEIVSAPITSFRKLDWESMRVNFFVIGSPSLLAAHPQNYLTSFYLPPVKAPLMNQFTQQFPNIMVVNTEPVLQQVRGMIQQVTQLVSGIFLFTLAAGLLVLYSVLLSEQDIRLQEVAVLRTLGGQKKQLFNFLRLELALLGLISGLLAALGASIFGWALAKWVIKITFTPSPSSILSAVVLGIVLIMITGELLLRKKLQQPLVGMLKGLRSE